MSIQICSFTEDRNEFEGSEARCHRSELLSRWPGTEACLDLLCPGCVLSRRYTGIFQWRWGHERGWRSLIAPSDALSLPWSLSSLSFFPPFRAFLSFSPSHLSVWGYLRPTQGVSYSRMILASVPFAFGNSWTCRTSHAALQGRAH